MIRTVLGDISSDKLKYCHSHEHIWIDGDIDDYECSLRELKLFAEAGGKSIVDAQPVNAGGSVEILKRLSYESGINIIACNGFHLDKYYADKRIPAVRFEKDTGIMKCALDVPGKSEIYKKAFEETIAIAKDAGFPILVHTEKNADILRFLDYIDAKNIDLHRVILCHLDRTADDLDIHEEVLKAGCYLEYDTVARYRYHDDDKECSIICDIVKRGYEKQILLGLDTTRQRLASYGGSPGLGFIRNEFEKILIKKGITEDIIKDFMVNNPGKAFNIE